MRIYVARSRRSALERIQSGAKGMVELDYDTGWEDAVELGRLGQKYGILVQFRSVEHIAVRSAEGLRRGLQEPKATFRQRHLYCLFDLTSLADAELRELEALAIGHGDYIIPGHLLREPTCIWD
ncbi:PHA-granule associated protein 4 [Cupriavidus necator]|uniref:PHA-granule associated protein 4 n=1 Tax=Cupriavidus necator TaxID=106590 RepID=UPI00339D941E